jgi:hypothetical protein
MAKKKWIPRDLHEGAFTAKAQAAGMDVQDYANYVTGPNSKASTVTKRQGNLAKTFKKMARRKKHA